MIEGASDFWFFETSQMTYKKDKLYEGHGVKKNVKTVRLRGLRICLLLIAECSINYPYVYY